MTTPLARFTVLDLTRVRSGPTCVRQLADWGANVIKIEATDEVDSGKGLAAFRPVVAQAVVVVENYRPDVKTRLSVD